MKAIFLYGFVYLLNFSAFSQEARTSFLKLYERNVHKDDTSLFFTIYKTEKGFEFMAPEKTFISYKIKDSSRTIYDSIVERISFSYGPYRFIKKKRKILFRNLGTDKKLRVLYQLSSNFFLAPELFSTSTDSYNINTSLIDSNAWVKRRSDKISCYKFLQILDGRFDKIYRLLFIEKSSLLPIRMEYYSDKRLIHLDREIFSL